MFVTVDPDASESVLIRRAWSLQSSSQNMNEQMNSEDVLVRDDIVRNDDAADRDVG